MEKTETPAVAVPKQWPPEVVERYEPLRELGRGGFASVLLAKSKQQQQPATTSSSQPEEFHAIKIVGSKYATRQELGYARREIDILVELQHPNIVKLVDHWEPPPDAHQCAAVMSLSYHSGPTLDNLLHEGGALSLVCARVLSAQLIDAVGYLHQRAVVHRDVKPDNIIVTYTGDRNDLWDYQQEEGEIADWKALREKWHLTLLDFGFARALTPNDYHKEKPKTNGTHSTSNGTTKGGNQLDVSNGSTRSNKSLSRSNSRAFTRSMSAVGNRVYSAPEIIRGVEHRGERPKLADSTRHPIDVTKTLSDHVSFYGLMADAYSLGNTVKYMLTGVPPNEDIDEVLYFEKNPVVIFCRFLCGLCATKDEKTERRVVHRRLSEIPSEAKRLVQALTHHDSHERASIRACRFYPWIMDPLEGLETFDIKGQSINYLSFALEASEKTETVQTVQ